MRSRRQTGIGRRQRHRGVSGTGILVGFVVALGITAVVGGPAYMVTESAWALMGVNLAGLLTGGAVAGMRARSVEPLNGALVGALGYAGTVTGVAILDYVLGRDTPLAGAPANDTLFYVVWGLLTVPLAIVGGLVGGRATRLP